MTVEEEQIKPNTKNSLAICKFLEEEGGQQLTVQWLRHHRNLCRSSAAKLPKLIRGSVQAKMEQLLCAGITCATQKKAAALFAHQDAFCFRRLTE